MDTSKLKEQDRPYVDQVVQYLAERGLTVELAGSALRGDQEYRDVDLAVTGPREAVGDTISGLFGFSGGTSPFPRRSPDGLEYKVESTGGWQMYINTTVANRIKIKVGETEMDLNFVRG